MRCTCFENSIKRVSFYFRVVGFSPEMAQTIASVYQATVGFLQRLLFCKD